METETPDHRINWSIYVLVLAPSALIGGLLAPANFMPMIPAHIWPWFVLGFGCFIAFILNILRPRYQETTGRWRKFYDFLLRQLPPSD
jgi:hypothetical protein